MEDFLTDTPIEQVSNLLDDEAQRAGWIANLPENERDCILKYINNSYERIAYNMLSKKIELSIAGKTTDLDDRIVNDWIYDLVDEYIAITDNRSKEKVKIPRKLGKVTDKTIYSFVNNNRVATPYDPIQEVFNRIAPLAADCTSTPTLDRFINCFQCKTITPESVSLYFKAWFAGIFTNYFNICESPFPHILILKSNQGKGKTEAMEKYLLGMFQRYVVKNFAWSDDKDELIKLATSFIIFDDELSATTKNKNEELKKMTSMRVMSNIRPAYGRIAENYIRRTTFLGATNESIITTDQTGTRRFLILDVDAIDMETIKKLNYEQLWSEAYNYYHIQKNTVYLSFADIEDNNTAFKHRSAEEEYLDRYFDLSKAPNSYWTATEIVEFLRRMMCDIRPEFTPISRLARIIRSRGIEAQTNKRHNNKRYSVVYYLHCTAPISEYYTNKLEDKIIKQSEADRQRLKAAQDQKPSTTTKGLFDDADELPIASIPE
jgi:hypothetical protein